MTEGMRLGRLEDAFGDVVQEIAVPAGGVLLYGLSSLAAWPISSLFLSARPASSRAALTG